MQIDMNVVIFAMVAAFVFAWWIIARMSTRKGWHWLLRHAAGAVGGVLSGALVVLLAAIYSMPRPANTPEVAKAAAPTVATPAPMPAPIPEPPSTPEPEPPVEDVAALAAETHEFLETAIVDIRLGLDAGDRQGLEESVDWPVNRYIQRWSDIPIPDQQPYEACFEALMNMQSISMAVLAYKDSLQRRKSLQKNADEFDLNMPACADQLRRKNA